MDFFILSIQFINWDVLNFLSEKYSKFLFSLSRNLKFRSLIILKDGLQLVFCKVELFPTINVFTILIIEENFTKKLTYKHTLETKTPRGPGLQNAYNQKVS